MYGIIFIILCSYSSYTIKYLSLQMYAVFLTPPPHTSHTQLKGKVMNKFRQELELKEEMAKKQRELEKVMEQLYAIRRGK